MDKKSEIMRTDDHRCDRGITSLRLTKRARVRSPVGSDFLVVFFWGFSSTVSRMSGKLRPQIHPQISLTIIIITNHSLRSPRISDLTRLKYCIMRGRMVILISESLIRSETLMELIFNPCGEFQLSDLVKNSDGTDIYSLW